MKRVQELIKRSALAKDAGILIHKPSNMFYLSGYTGEGLLVITHETRAIVTDFRYVEQAQARRPAGQSIITKDVNHAQLANPLLQRLKTAVWG